MLTESLSSLLPLSILFDRVIDDSDLKIELVVCLSAYVDVHRPEDCAEHYDVDEACTTYRHRH